MASVGSPPEAELLKEALNEKNKSSVFRQLLVIRHLNAWWLVTFFQPDEYFQSLEPAWQMAFGEGSGAWLTWEWQHQLRSSLHPALFAGAYWLADRLVRLVPFWFYFRAWVLIAVPSIVQTVFAAASDWYTWQLAVKIYGNNSSVSWFALYMSMFSPFQWYCSTRTFSNSVEMTLTIMALNYWPWELLGEAQPVKENPKPPTVVLQTTERLNSLRLSLILAAIAVVLRPTNILIWFTVVAVTLSRYLFSPNTVITKQTLIILLREVVLCGNLVLWASLMSDRLYFGQWTFPPYKFLYFNISQSLAVFYGRNDWHYYLSQGLPLLSITYLPFVLTALFKTPSVESKVSHSTLKALKFIIFTTIAALSLVSHKEVRFIYPLLPLIHILAAAPIASFFTTPAPAATIKVPLPKPKLKRRAFLLAALAINILLAFFLSVLHQPAPNRVLSFLRTEYERIHTDSLALPHMDRTHPLRESELFALFLMPCHSTPWRSHLVYPGLRARALTCEPPLHTQPNSAERANYRDEADRFYDDPIAFLGTEMWPMKEPGDGEEIPRFIVGFEGIEPWLNDFFRSEHGLDLGVRPKRVWEGWNGFFNEDSRRRGKMVVWSTGVYIELDT